MTRTALNSPAVAVRPRHRSRRIPLRLAAIGAATLLGTVLPHSLAQAAPTTSTDTEVAEAIASVNYYRALAGLPGVSHNDALAAGARNHSCYMLLNGMSHDESLLKPGYTIDGQYAGKHSNIAVTSDVSKSAEGFLQLWMVAPFHAIGVLRPNLTSVSYGSCADPAAPLSWHKGATLDILSGLGTKTPLAAPIVWPGNGASTRLDRFIVETPNPLAMCGWSSGGGLPVIAMMPEAVGNVSASITGPSGPLEVCALSQNNVTDASAKSILAGNNAITVLPRNQLLPGAYNVSVTTSARTVTWTFTVDPQAPLAGVAIAPPGSPDDPTPPAPTPVVTTQLILDTTVIGAAGGLTSIAPFRLADTREGLGATRLPAGSVTRFQVTGNNSVPLGAIAANANFTAINASSDGYITAYACTTTPPTASTVNFPAGAVTPNAAVIPLDASGGVCIFTNVDTDLVIDINGYTATASSSRFVATPATRVLDTRISLGATGRLAAGQILEVPVAGAGRAVPGNALAVALNVTAIDPTNSSFVTVYPCGTQPPLASNLNPAAGSLSANSAIVALGASGSICLYSPTDVDLVADLFGYFATGSGATFTPLAAIRALDTRDTQPALNLGTNTSRYAAGTVHEISLAGVRGIPDEATTMSINITATGSASTGYITVWDCSPNRPTVSTLNPAPGATLANGTQARLSAGGSICVYTQTDTHLIIDVNGFWS